MFNLTQFAGRKEWNPIHQEPPKISLSSVSSPTATLCRAPAGRPAWSRAKQTRLALGFFRDSLFGWMSRFSEDGCSLSLQDHRDPEKNASGRNWIVSDAPNFTGSQRKWNFAQRPDAAGSLTLFPSGSAGREEIWLVSSQFWVCLLLSKHSQRALSQMDTTENRSGKCYVRRVWAIRQL